MIFDNLSLHPEGIFYPPEPVAIYPPPPQPRIFFLQPSPSGRRHVAPRAPRVKPVGPHTSALDDVRILPDKGGRGHLHY